MSKQRWTWYEGSTSRPFGEIAAQAPPFDPQAFSIFNLDSDERVSIYELRRWLTHRGIGVPLSDEEFLMFAHEMGFRDGVESVPYKDLRGHPCWAT